MADFSALKTAIQTYIKQNGNEEITGEVLQTILLSVVTTLGDSAINDLITALNAEVAARQNADSSLEGAINQEGTLRSNADSTLQGNINAEATARENADTALSNRLGSTITAENTAAEQIGAEAEAREAADTALQGLIDGITDNIENGYVYAGIATPSSTPVTGKVFYLALTAGTYTHFGNTVVTQGINILKYNGSAWSLDAFIGIDDELAPGSNNLPKSGNVLENIIKNGSAFDLSAYNAVDGVLATYADLDAALAALNALPAVYKQGGMSMRYVQNSDNKYAQYRCIADEFTTDITQWAVNDAGVYVENPQYVKVVTDADGRILYAITTDGDFHFGKGCPQQVKNYIQSKIDEYHGDDIITFLANLENGDKTLQQLLNEKVDKEDGKGLVASRYVQEIYNPEYIKVIIDNDERVIEGLKTEGHKEINVPVKFNGDVSFGNGEGNKLNLNELDLTSSGIESLKDDLGLNVDTHAVNTVSYLKYNNINEQRGLFAIQMDLGFLDNDISGYLNMVNVLREYGLMSMDFAINITSLESPNIHNLLVLQREGCEIIYHNRINSPSDFSANSTLTVEEAKAGVCAERLQMTRKGFTTFGVVANNGSIGDQYKPMIDDLFFWSEYGSKQPHQAYQNTKSQYLADHRIIRTGFDMTDVEYETPGVEEQEINYAKTWIDNLCTNKTFGVMYCHYFGGTADVYRLHETTLRAIAAYIVEKINNGELYYGSTTECLNLLCK